MKTFQTDESDNHNTLLLAPEGYMTIQHEKTIPGIICLHGIVLSTSQKLMVLLLTFSIESVYQPLISKNQAHYNIDEMGSTDQKNEHEYMNIIH